MRNLFLLFIIATYLVNNAQGQAQWEKIYQRNLQSLEASAIIQCSDGNFVLVGTAQLNVFIIKLNIAGDTIWTKTIAMRTSSRGFDLKQTPDSGLIITGSVFENGIDDLFLIRTDLNGNIQWAKSYGGINNEVGNSVCIIPGGGFIVAGYTHTYGAGAGHQSIYIVRTDQNGDTISTRVLWEPGKTTVARTISPTSNGFIVAGIGGEGAALVRLDVNGDTLWTNSLGSFSGESGLAAIQALDGGFLFTGGVSCSSTDRDFFTIKTDSMGLLQWARAYGGPDDDVSVHIIQKSDSSILIGGGYGYFSAIDSIRELFIKTNSLGDTIWTRCYDPFQYGTVSSFIATADSGYFFAGTQNNSGEYFRLYGVKTDGDGNTHCSSSYVPVSTCIPLFTQSRINMIVSSTSSVVSDLVFYEGGGCSDSLLCSTNYTPELTGNHISIFPNPALQQISFIGFLTGTISIFNLLGEELIRTEFVNKSEKQSIVDVSRLSNGIYFVRVETENGSSVQKLVKQ